MKQIRFLALLLCIAMMTALLYGCGGSAESEQAMDYAYEETMAATEAAMEKTEDGITSSYERKAIISAAFFGSPT